MFVTDTFGRHGVLDVAPFDVLGGPTPPVSEVMADMTNSTDQQRLIHKEL